jgi:hypothetical protein
MSRNTIMIKTDAPLLIIVVLLAIFLVSAGCVTQSPVNTRVTAVPSQSPAINTQEITSTVSPAVTFEQAIPTLLETPVPVQAYIKMPFGYVQYVYNPAHSVRLLESHVETDSSGAQVIIGTIKNIGPDRIDLIVVTITLYDADGNVIGSSSTDANYIDPNKVWKFRTDPLTRNDFKNYKIAEIFTG